MGPEIAHSRTRKATRTNLFEILERAYRRYRDVNGHIYAAAISYFSMISLFPWLIFIVTMLTLLVRDPVVQSQIITQVVDQFPPGARIRGELRAFVSEITVRRSGVLGLAGLVTTIIVASEAFRALRYALNAVFGVTQTRSVLRGRGIDLLGMLVVLLFGTVSAAMATLLDLAWIERITPATGGSLSVPLLIIGYTLQFLLTFVAFVLMYRVVPEISMDWRILWIPGLIAAIGFEAARISISLFLNYFERFQQIYGALSVTVVALVFVFVVANIVLIAAAIACEVDLRQYQRESSHAESREPEEPVSASG
ncbi:MAG: YihY/virulence factor BrkB family protein [Sphaerobacteraceae bacterium]|nr:MAG: YihY/virulence factor BrkB family protein [Sphaerobacteraceae bacterium]